MNGNSGFIDNLVRGHILNSIRNSRERAEFAIGDHVICDTGVTGIVIKMYFPTASEQQTMIQCDDGRKYHAPTRMFRKDAY